MIGRGAFQETDVFGMTLPVVKHSYLIMDIHEIPRVVKEAFHIAQTGRPGPVVIDIPKNIQNQTAQPIFPQELTLRRYTIPAQPDPVALNEVIGLIKSAQRTMIYAGGGGISANAAAALLCVAGPSPNPLAPTVL